MMDPFLDYTQPRRLRPLLVKILIYALLIFWSLVCLFPLYWITVTSFKSEVDIMNGPYYLPFIDFTPSLNAWITDFTYANDHLLSRFFNSAVETVGSTPEQLASTMKSEMAKTTKVIKEAGIPQQ